MRATTLRVHNVRSFSDVELSIHPYAVLVGANNSGKSNAITAIRLFYEKDAKYDRERDFPKFPTTDEQSWVEIEFSLSCEEAASLAPKLDVKGERLRVRRYLQIEETGGPKKAGYYSVEGDVVASRECCTASDVKGGLLGRVTYVPAVSKLDDHTKTSGPSALRDLITGVLDDLVQKSGAYEDLKSAVNDFEKRIKGEQSAEGLSLALIESRISEEIRDWSTSFVFSVDPPAAEDLVKSFINHQIVDGKLNRELSASDFGSGFQRHLIFTVIKLAAEFASRGMQGAKRASSPQLNWILFEEPEAFLHPEQVDVLSTNLRTIAEKEPTQVLITTHNPQFVSRRIDRLPSIARLCRHSCESVVHQVYSEALASIIEMNQVEVASWGVETSPDDLTTEMESIKYCLWLNPLRCSAFFASRVLIVEGVAEVALLNYLIETTAVDLSGRPVFVMDALGKYNIHRFMSLFHALGIFHAVLYDDDGGKGAHQAIHATINDTRNEHTIGIDCIEGNLETYLGIPPVRRQDRKPQHVMYHVQSANVPEDRLAALSLKVEALLRYEDDTEACPLDPA